MENPDQHEKEKPVPQNEFTLQMLIAAACSDVLHEAFRKILPPPAGIIVDRKILAVRRESGQVLNGKTPRPPYKNKIQKSGRPTKPRKGPTRGFRCL